MEDELPLSLLPPSTDHAISTAARISARISGLKRGLLDCKKINSSSWMNYSERSVLVDFGLQHTNIGQITVFFVVIQTVAHHKLVRHTEALIIGLDIGLAAAGLVKDSTVLWVCGGGFAEGLAPDADTVWVLQLECEKMEEVEHEYE